mmetsp:Transcript_74292/g.187187  ORF Transcript_74292/g.187187 Transcript_74292/m.187187 type:complete len:218 (+) Transcript_74292:332-985(+)
MSTGRTSGMTTWRMTTTKRQRCSVTMTSSASSSGRHKPNGSLTSLLPRCRRWAMREESSWGATPLEVPWRSMWRCTIAQSRLGRFFASELVRCGTRWAQLRPSPSQANQMARCSALVRPSESQCLCTRQGKMTRMCQHCKREITVSLRLRASLYGRKSSRMENMTRTTLKRIHRLRNGLSAFSSKATRRPGLDGLCTILAFAPSYNDLGRGRMIIQH